nr:proprotein convertase P-domain-containing protein [Bacteroidota bacterium]
MTSFAVRNILFFLIGVLGFSISHLQAQCVTTGAQSIPDPGTLTIDFFVNGLIDSDLASPTQGICGIQIDFSHEYLGDLTASLISPSGTIVQLIGPVTTAGSNTNLSRWIVEFVPCASIAMPDAGFNSTWSNLDSWQALTTYTGTYFPASGCLDDFNAGSANGLWQIIFEDHDAFQIGIVNSVTLIFCNPNGLQCNACAPNGGSLSPSSMTLCEDDLLISSDLIVDFTGNIPSPAEYNYQYIFSNGNSILNAGSSITMSPPPGSYTLCGLSYLIADSAQIRTLLATSDLAQLNQSISNGSVCADLTSPCVPVTVIPIPDTVKVDHQLCRDETYIYRNQLYTVPGVYLIVEDGLNACDSVFRINITMNNLNAIIATPDSISCGGGGVLLDGNASGGGVGTTLYDWMTQNGVISGNPSSSQVMATVPGLYTLTVGDGICEVSSDVVVEGDASYPLIFLQGGALTCSNPTIDIHPVVIPTNVSYSWSGPFGFSSQTRDILVNIPGRYFLTVISPAGCQVTAYNDIISDEAGPDATIIEFDRVCPYNAGVLGTQSSGMLYEWDGPNGPYPPNQAILVTTTGDFSLTVTNPQNGCSSVGTITYDPDFTLPIIIYSGLD